LLERVKADEHKQAVEWINQHTDENIGFILIEIEPLEDKTILASTRNSIVLNVPMTWSRL
jgi:hypothetical protein